MDQKSSVFEVAWHGSKIDRFRSSLAWIKNRPFSGFLGMDQKSTVFGVPWHGSKIAYRVPQSAKYRIPRTAERSIPHTATEPRCGSPTAEPLGDGRGLCGVPNSCSWLLVGWPMHGGVVWYMSIQLAFALASISVAGNPKTVDF